MARSGSERPDRLPIRLIIGVGLAVLALVFVLQNTGRGTVRFLAWNVAAPAWIWLIIIFGSGVVVGSIFPWFRRRR